MKITKKVLLNSINLTLLLLYSVWLGVPHAGAQNSSDGPKKVQKQLRRQVQQEQPRQPAAPQQETQQTSAATAPGANASAPPAAKKTGVVRVGVLMPQAQMGEGSSGANLSEPLRNTLISYLSGPTLEVVPITSRIPIQIEAEIKQKELDYVLTTSVTQKKGGGGFGSFLKKVAPIAAMASPIGMIGMAGGMGGVIAATAVGTGIDLAGTMAGSVKAKDEITFTYSLTAPGSQTPRLTNTSKVKAKKDGEDVLTPLIEQAATVFVTEVGKK